jgi:zinc protease
VSFAKRLGLSAGLGGALLMLAAPAQGLPRPETFTLKNGMDVLVITDRRAPVVTQQIWIKAGAADEPRGESGIAHFLEHLMFKGTPSIPPGEFSKIIARNGGDDNAQTSEDYTMYYERIARDRLGLIMKMDADRMANLRLDEKNVLSERDVIIEERRQRTDNNPGARLYERMMAMLHPHHPYGTPTIGWLSEMKTLSRQDAIDWYKARYAPNNALLVVAGDIDAAELKPLAEKYYGRLKPNPHLPPRVWTQDPPQDVAMRVSLADPKVRQPSITRLYTSISYGTVTKPLQAHALDLAGDILGGSETSRLYRALVEDKKLAVAAGASADTSGLGGGTFAVFATPAEGVSLDTLEKAMDEVIDDFLKTGPTAEELARSKSEMVASAVYAQDSQESLANIFGGSLAAGETVDAVVNWDKDIQTVSAAQVSEIARETLTLDHSVTGLLLPAPGAPADDEPDEVPPLGAGPIR